VPDGNRFKTSKWSRLAQKEHGISNGSFFNLLGQLELAEKVQKSAIDEKWQQLQNHSKTSHPYKDQ
jgi:hypothetical protein